MRYVMGMIMVLAAVTAGAQSLGAPDLIQQLAQRTAALGQCHQQLGALEVLSAQVIGGVFQTQDQWRTTFEAANPGKTIDARGVMTEKPSAP